MKLHEIINVHSEPFFRKMKVESGFMYDFYDCERDEYKNQWIFVPHSSERVKKLEHHRDTTVGLWATDKPELIDDPKGLLFVINEQHI